MAIEAGCRAVIFSKSLQVQYTDRVCAVQVLCTTLRVFDLLGREIATLVDENLAAGVHKAEWNAERFSSGVYLYQLRAGEYVETKKLLLLR